MSYRVTSISRRTYFTALATGGNRPDRSSIRFADGLALHRPEAVPGVVIDRALRAVRAEPVIDQRHHKGEERGDKGSRDDSAQPGAPQRRQRRENKPEQDVHDDQDQEHQYQRAEHMPPPAPDKLLAAPERRQRP